MTAILWATSKMTVIKTQPIQPLIWKRYIDDIFMIWTGSKSQLIRNLNQFHPSIKFTHEILDTNVAFLDLENFKGHKFEANNTLSTKTHFKKTNTMQKNLQLKKQCKS